MPHDSTLQLVADLSRATSPDDYHAALQKALAAQDALNETIQQQAGIALVCHAGCSLCCWLRVDVYAPEVFLIAETLRQTLAPAELAELKERLKAHAGIVTRLTPFEHATRNIPCPLSRNGWCTVYAVRPHTCRRHHSQALPSCQFTYDHPDDLEFPGAHHRELFRDLTEAMGEHAAAYEYCGFDGTIYELGSALEEALSSPASWKRWLNKKQAFKRASVTPAG